MMTANPYLGEIKKTAANFTWYILEYFDTSNDMIGEISWILSSTKTIMNFVELLTEEDISKLNNSFFSSFVV